MISTKIAVLFATRPIAYAITIRETVSIVEKSFIFAGVQVKALNGKGGKKMNPYVCDCGNEKQDDQAFCDECRGPKPPSKPVVPSSSRPGPKKKKDPRSRIVRVMLTNKEFSRLSRLSKRRSMSLSDYLARAVWPERRS